MPINKFEKLRQAIYFNDNSKLIPRDEPGHDKLFIIRPVIDFINRKFNAISLEHICPEMSKCVRRKYETIYADETPQMGVQAICISWSFRIRV